MRTLSRINRFVTIALLAITIGCGNGGGVGEPAAVSEVRVIHLSPNAPAFDVSVDSGPVLEGMSFTTSSEYIGIDSGSRLVEFKVSGTAKAAINFPLIFKPETRYSLIAINSFRSIETLLLPDQTFAPAGNAAIRIVHGAPALPKVDIYLTATDEELEKAVPILRNVPFKVASSYITVRPGQHRIRVTAAGSKAVAIDSGTITLTEGQVTTALASDTLGGGPPFSFLLAKDNL